MLVFFASTIEQTQTLQSSINALAELKILLTTILSAAMLVGVLNLIFYLTSKHSPDLSLYFLLPTINFRRKNVQFDIENQIGRPLGFTRLTIFKNEKIFRTYYHLKSNFAISLPQGNYRATIDKFGFVAASTDVFSTSDEKLKFNLSLRRCEDLKDGAVVRRLSTIALIANTVLAGLTLVALFRFYASLGVGLQIILLALTIFSAVLAKRFYDFFRAIRLINFKNQPLKFKDVEILNSKREMINSFTTDKDGRLFIALAPGLYKFSPEDYNDRTVRINESGLGFFRVRF